MMKFKIWLETSVPSNYLSIGHYRKNKENVLLWHWVRPGKIETIPTDQYYGHYEWDKHGNNGRINLDRKEGSIAFTTNNLIIKRQVIKDVIDKFPDIQFWVFGEGPPYKASQWLEESLDIRFVANNPQSQQKGLMGQKPLKSNEAVLFTYPNETKNQFWNKNVSFPIDVAFFNKNKELVDVITMEAGQTKPISSKKPFQYVLETPAGYFSSIPMGTNLEQFI
jgi:uncharacterized membrane protein (UPF0127 family)